MKKRNRNRILSLPLLLLATVLLSVTVLAAEPTGSIAVKLKPENYNYDAVSGVDITLWRVADFSEGKYEILPAYADSNVDLNDNDTAQRQETAAHDLSLFINKNQISGMQRTTNFDGEASFAELQTGLYLLQVADVISTKTTVVTNRFLVPIPLENPDVSGMLYDVVAEPKGYIDTKGKLPQTGQKVLAIWVCAALGLVLVSLGGVRLHRNKNGQNYADK
ncbi:MAG: hypothetical protein RR177_01845 [Oscillospiraceae bacterium]